MGGGCDSLFYDTTLLLTCKDRKCKTISHRIW